MEALAHCLRLQQVISPNSIKHCGLWTGAITHHDPDRDDCLADQAVGTSIFASAAHLRPPEPRGLCQLFRNFLWLSWERCFFVASRSQKCYRHGFTITFFFAVIGLELRASHLLDNCSTSWAMSRAGGLKVLTPKSIPRASDLAGLE
jgi:hypothetical protein